MAAHDEAGGEDCVAPAIGVVAEAAPISCDPGGWFEIGPADGVSKEDASLLV